MRLARSRGPRSSLGADHGLVVDHAKLERRPPPSPGRSRRRWCRHPPRVRRRPLPHRSARSPPRSCARSPACRIGRRDRGHGVEPKSVRVECWKRRERDELAAEQIEQLAPQIETEGRDAVAISSSISSSLGSWLSSPPFLLTGHLAVDGQCQQHVGRAGEGILGKHAASGTGMPAGTRSAAAEIAGSLAMAAAPSVPLSPGTVIASTRNPGSTALIANPECVCHAASSDCGIIACSLQSLLAHGIQDRRTVEVGTTASPPEARRRPAALPRNRRVNRLFRRRRR